MLVVELEKEEEQYRIINVFKQLYKGCNTECLIIVDFNIVMSQHDISVNNVFKEDASRKILKANKRERSRFLQVAEGKLKQSRIDFCLVTSVFQAQHTQQTAGVIIPSRR